MRGQGEGLLREKSKEVIWQGQVYSLWIGNAERLRTVFGKLAMGALIVTLMHMPDFIGSKCRECTKYLEKAHSVYAEMCHPMQHAVRVQAQKHAHAEHI